MKLFSNKKGIEFTFKTVVTLIIMVIVLIVLTLSSLNLGKSGSSGASSLALQQDIFECEELGRCDFKNCDIEDCSDDEKAEKKWELLKNSVTECEKDKEIECGTLQELVKESIENNNNNKNVPLLTKEEINKIMKEDFFTKNKNKFESYANSKGIDVNMLYAIILKEGAYRNKFEDTVRFECHLFNRNSPDNMQCSFQNGESFSRIPSETNYDAYLKAKNINSKVAFESTSFGFAQILGINYVNLGLNIDYSKGLELLKNEDLQIDYFFKFLEKNGIIDYIKQKNWQKIAEKYNGLEYAQNNYDTDIKNIYNQIA